VDERETFSFKDASAALDVKIDSTMFILEEAIDLLVPNTASTSKEAMDLFVPNTTSTSFTLEFGREVLNAPVMGSVWDPLVTLEIKDVSNIFEEAIDSLGNNVSASFISEFGK
jgi:hypothetical protein